MKTIAELIALAANPWDMTADDSKDIETKLKQLAAIEAAVPEEVREIQERHQKLSAQIANATRLAHECDGKPDRESVLRGRDAYLFTATRDTQDHRDLGTLLAIVQRQAADNSQLRARDAALLSPQDNPEPTLPAPPICPNCDKRVPWAHLTSDHMMCYKEEGGCGFSLSLDPNDADNLRLARDAARAEVEQLTKDRTEAIKIAESYNADYATACAEAESCRRELDLSRAAYDLLALDLTEERHKHQATLDEHQEYRKRLGKILKPVGIDRGLLEIELAQVRMQDLEQAKQERRSAWEQIDAFRAEGDRLRRTIDSLADKREAADAETTKARADLKTAGTLIIQMRDEINRLRERAEASEQSVIELTAIAHMATETAERRTNDLLAAEDAARAEKQRADKAEQKVSELLDRADGLPPNRFDCDDCGRGVAVDEDGCCSMCGAGATRIEDGKVIK